MAEKQTVIILHGWGLSGRVYQPLTRLLAEHGFRIYSPDLPGFGKSKQPPYVWGIKEYAKHLHLFIVGHQLKKPILLGHSFGGRVALMYNYIYPEGAKALILTGTPGYSSVPKSKRFLAMWLAKVGRFTLSLLPMGEYRRLFQRLFYRLVGARDFYRANDLMGEVFKTVVQEPLDDYMRSIRCPCLLIWGGKDSVVPQNIAGKMARIIPKAQLVVVPEADHGLPFKQPVIFWANIKSFLQSL